MKLKLLPSQKLSIDIHNLRQRYFLFVLCLVGVIETVSQNTGLHTNDLKCSCETQLENVVLTQEHIYTNNQISFIWISILYAELFCRTREIQSIPP